ncbi:hypothetical protein HF086_013469 [Spodoptera exigua]|uniref:uridine/cytidine kinase n=1 Tax=Spodoptera exigua TaxID=7107 RepID=A0A922MFT8_SPOEX|nr:hypothetical protein HF086_013469 [Spodoptera exigua]
MSQPNKRTTAESILHADRRTIYTAGRPPWYNCTGGQEVEPFLIGICGASASGKTTVATKIIESLNIPWVTIVSMDSFYKVLNEKQHQAANRNEYNFDHPDAFDIELLISVLQRLREGKKVEVPIYNYVTHSRENRTKTMYGANVIIFEGILAFYNAEVTKMLDMKVFVDTDADIRLARRLRRWIKLVVIFFYREQRHSPAWARPGRRAEAIHDAREACVPELHRALHGARGHHRAARRREQGRHTSHRATCTQTAPAGELLQHYAAYCNYTIEQGRHTSHRATCTQTAPAGELLQHYAAYCNYTIEQGRHTSHRATCTQTAPAGELLQHYAAYCNYTIEQGRHTSHRATCTQTAPAGELLQHYAAYCNYTIEQGRHTSHRATCTQTAPTGELLQHYAAYCNYTIEQGRHTSHRATCTQTAPAGELLQHYAAYCNYRGFKVREKLAIAHIGQPVPDSLYVLKETPQVPTSSVY